MVASDGCERCVESKTGDCGAHDSAILRVMSRSPFNTIQGEGALTGVPSTFLRLAGCDLRCVWCDTPESLPDWNVGTKAFLPRPTGNAYEVYVDELAYDLAEIARRHLVVTGGEPMLQTDGLIDLLSRQVLPFKHVTLETNGRHFDPLLANLIDLPSLSPKVATWGDVERTATANWLVHCAAVGKSVQLKVVVASPMFIQYAEAKKMFDWARDHYPDVRCIVQPEAGFHRGQTGLLADRVWQDDLCLLMPQAHKVLGVAEP